LTGLFKYLEVKRFLLIAAAGLFVAACANEITPSSVETARGEQYHAARIINSSSDAVPGRVMIKMKDGGSPELSGLDWVVSCERVCPVVPGTEDRAKSYGLDRWYEVVFAESFSVTEAAKALCDVADVQYVEYNTRMYKASDCVVKPYDGPIAATKGGANWSPFNDPSVGDQWHYYNVGDVSIASTAKAGADINVKDAWRLTTGDPRIVVAVVDEGVYYDHPDLQGNIWTNDKEIPDNGIDDDNNGYVDDIHGINCVTKGQISWGKAKDTGHGTHIAGTIAAVNNNGIGVCGIAGGDGSHGGVKIMSCQVFDGGSQSSAGFVRAMKYAADNGASIIQCSYGYSAGTFTTDAGYAYACSAEMEAVAYFLDKSNCPEALDGNVAIYAAGNDSKPLSGYPGAYYKYISVASIASDGLPAYYTNYGPAVNISAPGGEYYTGGKLSEAAAVLSTLPYANAANGYGYMQGTSMACPHATGVAALALSYMLKRGIKLTNNEFMSTMLTSANDINDRLTGSKRTIVGNQYGDLVLSPYRNNMGTGYIDTWRFLMQLDGVPSILAKVGESQRLDISGYFGGCSKNLTYLSVEMSEEDMAALGIKEQPEMKYGRLKIYPTKPGCAVVKVEAIGGGDTLGNGSNMGGAEVNRTISIIARGVVAENGGWL